jgi:hypothetical protein
MLKSRFALLALVVAATLSVAGTASAQVADWPDVFDPTVVHHLNLQTVGPDCETPQPSFWPLVQQDTSFNLEVAARFWADGETPICVSLRQKSNTPLGPPSDPKVALKIDVNEIVSGQRWHGLRKLSLENGDDANPAAEGIAWQMYQAAANAPGAPPDFTPGLASWVTLAVNGTEYGVYVNVEQRDKSYLQNRSIYTSGLSWLYKFGEVFEAVVPTGSDPNFGTDSSTHLTLCYSPFFPVTCATPDDATLETQLNALVDMDALLTQGAVESIIVAPDQTFSASKNYYFADWDSPIIRKRRYFPWDLDTVFTNVNESVYGTSPFQDILLNHPTFGPQYDDIICDLLAGPLSATNLTTLVTDVESLLSAPLKAHPDNNNIGNAAQVDAYFDDLRQYMVDRVANVDDEVICAPEPGTIPSLAAGLGLLAVLHRRRLRAAAPVLRRQG